MTATMPKPADRPLRVFLFGTRGYMSVVLQRLLPDPRVTVVGLCSAKPAGLLQRSRARGGALQRRLHLRGRADFLVRDPFTHCADPWALANRNGIARYAYQDVKRPEFLSAVQAARPDILLSAGFPRLIPTTVIQAPALVGINLHPSLLPRHRGGTPNRWIVRKGERETGITAHVLDADFDTGDILGQWPIALDAGMSWGDVEHKILENLPTAIDTIVAECVTGALARTPQPAGAGEYEPPFRGQHAWIDWTLPFDETERTCLATRPKTGAMSALRGRRQCIWSVSRVAADSVERPAAPGTILRINADGLPVVACGDGEALTIDRIVAYGSIRNSTGWPDFRPGLCFQSNEESLA